MNSNRLRRGLAISALAVFLLAAPAGCRRPQDTDAVKVGIIAPFEGAGRALGYEVLAGARIAIAPLTPAHGGMEDAGGIHGRPVELVALNDEDAPRDAAFQVRKLAVDPAVAGVIGPWSYETAGAAVPEFAALALPAFLPVPGLTPPEGACIVSFAPSPETLARSAASFLRQRDIKAPVSLVIDIPQLEEPLREELRRAGVVVLDAGSGAAPSAILLATSDERAAEVLRRYPHTPALVLSTPLPSHLAALAELEPDSPVYLWHPLWEGEERTGFEAAFRAQTGHRPSTPASMAYLAMREEGAALASLPPHGVGREELCAHLRSADLTPFDEGYGIEFLPIGEFLSE